MNQLIVLQKLNHSTIVRFEIMKALAIFDTCTINPVIDGKRDETRKTLLANVKTLPDKRYEIMFPIHELEGEYELRFWNDFDKTYKASALFKN